MSEAPARRARVAVIGLGLIGGSLALATRARGYDLEESVRDRARERGIDVAETPEECARGAEIAVAAVPPASLRGVLARLATAAPGAVLTDVASSKRELATIAGALPEGTRVVGSHPLAGGTSGGIDAADAALFRGRAWAIVPTPRSDTASVAAVGALARGLGARPILVSAARHETLVAWLTRAPLAIAGALAHVAAREGPAGLLELAGPGFGDTTRLAATSAELADELLFADPSATGAILELVAAELHGFAGDLSRGDRQAVAERLAVARELRAQLERARSESTAK